MSLLEKVKSLARKHTAAIVSNRRHLHTYPELSFKEYNTSAYIKEALTAIGIPYISLADTGVLATIEGRLPSNNVVALRADIDALPIQEENQTAYASKHPGVMHACGHDMHTAMLLGLARIANDMRDDFGGTLKLMFQPAEEKFPGGAKRMINEGALSNPTPGFVIGQHVMPELPAGKIGWRKGHAMASNDEVYMWVRGRGGHGAQPQENIDPVSIAAYIITALQQLVSRMANPKTPTVLSFGKIIANGATNIIPDEVYIEGTLRTVDENWRKEAHERIRKMAYSIAEGMNASCEIKIQGFPSVINDALLTEDIRRYAEEFVGAENVQEIDLWMAGEDFGEYAQVVPGCFYRIGTGNTAKNMTASLHTPLFDIDDEPVSYVGSGLMTYAALKKLGN